jgi:hypothetical protein
MYPANVEDRRYQNSDLLHQKWFWGLAHHYEFLLIRAMVSPFLIEYWERHVKQAVVECSIESDLLGGHQIVHVGEDSKQVLKKLTCRELDAEDILWRHLLLHEGLEVDLLALVNVEDIILLLSGGFLHFSLLLLML